MIELVEAIAALNPGDDDDWFPAESFTVRPPKGAAPHWFFMTKLHWLGEDLVPDAGIISCAGVLGPQVNACIQRIVGDHELRFVGDLDVSDIVSFLTLKQSRVSYLGIQDDWLQLANARKRIDGSVRMSDFEKRAIAELEARHALDFLGPDCRALLASGRKFEVEGGSNGALYAPGFRNELRALLFE